MPCSSPYLDAGSVLLLQCPSPFLGESLGAHYMPGTALSVAEKTVNKEKALSPWSLHSVDGGGGIQTIDMSTGK